MEFSYTPNAARLAWLAFALAASTAIAFAQTEALPQTVPAPEVHSVPAGNVPPARIGDTPVPETRPDEGKAGAAEPAQAVPALPSAESAPVPTENPQAPDEKPTDKQPAATEPALPAHAPPPPDGTMPAAPTEPAKGQPPEAAPAEKPASEPKPAEETAPKAESAKPNEVDARSGRPVLTPMPKEELECRARLKTLGVEFIDKPAESDPAGCSMPYPLSVSSLGKSVALQPPALMDCALAEAAAGFTASVIAPQTKLAFGQDLKAIDQASAYVCRPRHGTHKLSEHAFGNALDIARFVLADGKAIDVEPAPDEKAAQFLAAVRKAACGPFKTVLGPGSDADHALHFHFDLAPRRNGGTFCQ